MVTKYCRLGLDGLCPVFVMLRYENGHRWVEAVEPGVSYEGVEMWELGSIPTPTEADEWLEHIKSELDREFEEPGSASEEITERCHEFEGSIMFVTPHEEFEYDELWFDAHRQPDDEYQGTNVRLDTHRIYARKSNRKLAAMAKAIRSERKHVEIVDLDRYLVMLRATCRENVSLRSSGS